MKRFFTALVFLLLWASSFGQTKASVNSVLLEDNAPILFRPVDILTSPQVLLKVWINDPIPVDFYSEKEKEIQKLINDRTAEGIITYSPIDKKNEWLDVDYEEITPFTWKWVDFELQKPDGTLTKINLRRPHWWLKEIDADSIGKKVYLNMPELGSKGWAKVVAIRVNQLDTRFWDESRGGDYVSRPITGKFTHESNDVYLLYFKGNQTPLGVTGNHLIWSEDRLDWIGAKDLRINETVKTYAGISTLKKRLKKTGRHTVYNLEIYKDHNFQVSQIGILVHNNCFTKMQAYNFDDWKVKGVHVDVKDVKSKLKITEALLEFDVNGNLVWKQFGDMGGATGKQLKKAGKQIKGLLGNKKIMQQAYDNLGLLIKDYKWHLANGTKKMKEMAKRNLPKFEAMRKKVDEHLNPGKKSN